MARSFESINYMLRPNKNVERKLIASTFRRLASEFPIPDYRYVGFGSMWFTDFVLMHKVLGIDDMVTIEMDKSREKRVRFNKPFACIEVRMEHAATALGDLLGEKPTAVWLDYDGPLKSAFTGDLQTAIGAMQEGSCILVSVNAVADQLRNQKDDDKELSPAEYLARVVGTDVGQIESARLTRTGFPQYVADLIHAQLKAAVLNSKPGCDYVPIWSFDYSDGAVMVTVGGMVATEAQRLKIKACHLDELFYLDGAKLYSIDVPVLTDKEKRALDSLLPSKAPLKAKSLDFELRPSEVDAYQKFYLEYPVFNEISS